MLVLVGIYHLFAGLVGIFNDTFYVVGQDWVFKFDTTAWGWTHLIFGALVALAGFGIFTGNLAARIVGVLAASISMVVNFAWLPYAPVWATIMIAISAAVIWSLTVHGRDIAD
jgi:hypothetical protein